MEKALQRHHPELVCTLNTGSPAKKTLRLISVKKKTSAKKKVVKKKVK